MAGSFCRPQLYFTWDGFRDVNVMDIVNKCNNPSLHVTHYVLDFSYIYAHWEILPSSITLNPLLLIVYYGWWAVLSSVRSKDIHYVYFTDRVILAASRCIEEHKLNLDCNLPVSIASPDHFRCEFYYGGIFSKLLQSVFPLFIAFVRIVSAVFCRCPCTAVCTCICLLLTVPVRYRRR